MTQFLDVLLRALRDIGRRLARSQRGNVLVLIGFAAPVLVTTAGFATDYAYASYLKQSLDKSIDTAVLASTSQAAAASGAGYGDLTWLRSYGLAIFQGNIAKLGVSVTPTLTVVANGTGGVVSNGSYTYGVPTRFGSIFGLRTITIAGKASATANPVTYINYYIVIDVSQSMGIGATQADMANLYARTVAYNNRGCVFGCHVTTSGDPYANEYLAHNISPRISLRIDAAIAAIQTIIQDAQNASGQNRNIKIGVYTMNLDPTVSNPPKINTVSSPTADFPTLTGLVNNITLGGNNSGGIGDSDFANELSQFNSLIPTNGSGSSASSPKNYIFIVSDAAGDTSGNCTWGHCMAALSPSYCASLKVKAIVGTIYTTYLPIYNENDSTKGLDGSYSTLVGPIADQLAPNMLNCATSSDYYYQATDGPALNTAMQKLFASTLNTARLTQ